MVFDNIPWFPIWKLPFFHGFSIAKCQDVSPPTTDRVGSRPLSGISTHGSHVAESVPLRPPQCRGLIRQTGSPGGTKKFLDGSMKSKKDSMYIYLSIYLAIYLAICLSVYLSIHLSINLRIYMTKLKEFNSNFCHLVLQGFPNKTDLWFWMTSRLSRRFERRRWILKIKV